MGETHDNITSVGRDVKMGGYGGGHYHHDHTHHSFQVKHVDPLEKCDFYHANTNKTIADTASFQEIRRKQDDIGDSIKDGQIKTLESEIRTSDRMKDSELRLSKELCHLKEKMLDKFCEQERENRHEHDKTRCVVEKNTAELKCFIKEEFRDERRFSEKDQKIEELKNRLINISPLLPTLAKV